MRRWQCQGGDQTILPFAEETGFAALFLPVHSFEVGVYQSRECDAVKAGGQAVGRGNDHQLIMCEPLRGWRHVKVTQRRTRCDYAACVRELVDVHYPRARKIRLVQDNLNTHDGASLYEAFVPDEARRILDPPDYRS